MICVCVFCDDDCQLLDWQALVWSEVHYGINEWGKRIPAGVEWILCGLCSQMHNYTSQRCNLPYEMTIVRLLFSINAVFHCEFVARYSLLISIVFRNVQYNMYLYYWLTVTDLIISYRKTALTVVSVWIGLMKVKRSASYMQCRNNIVGRVPSEHGAIPFEDYPARNSVTWSALGYNDNKYIHYA